MNHEREIGYCETCGRVLPWVTVIAQGYKCLCGSEQVSRGQTDARYKIDD